MCYLYEKQLFMKSIDYSYYYEENDVVVNDDKEEKE